MTLLIIDMDFLYQFNLGLIAPIFTVSFHGMFEKNMFVFLIFKSWQVCDWLAMWIIMLWLMDLMWPRVFRRSNVGLVKNVNSWYDNDNLPDIFEGFCVRNRDRNVHQYNIRNADELYVPYARLDNRKFSIKISGAKLWNVLPNYIKESSSVDVFKQNLRNYLIDNMIVT